MLTGLDPATAARVAARGVRPLRARLRLRQRADHERRRVRDAARPGGRRRGDRHDLAAGRPDARRRRRRGDRRLARGAVVSPRATRRWWTLAACGAARARARPRGDHPPRGARRPAARRRRSTRRRCACMRATRPRGLAADVRPRARQPAAARGRRGARHELRPRRALRRLARQPMSMGELAAALGIDPPNATVLVADLEAQGLVRRAPHPTDGRAKLVEATRKGKAAGPAGRRDPRHAAAGAQRARARRISRRCGGSSRALSSTRGHNSVASPGESAGRARRNAWCFRRRVLEALHRVGHVTVPDRLVAHDRHRRRERERRAGRPRTLTPAAASTTRATSTAAVPASRPRWNGSRARISSEYSDVDRER